MADDAMFADVMEAVARLRIAFLKHNLAPPTSIELGHVRDADFFRWSLPKDMVLMQPRMGVDKDNPEWVCNIQGVEVRMPAQWRGTKAGHRELYEPEFHSFPFPSAEGS